MEQFAVNFRVQQAHDLALVVGHIERDVPAEVIVAHRCDGQQQFHALVGQFPYVDHLGAEAGGAGNTSVEDVILRFPVVVGEVHSNAVVKHAQVEAEFDLGIRQRGKRCIGDLAGSDAAQRLAEVALAEQPVGQQQLVGVGVAAHLCPGSAQFGKRDRLWQAHSVGKYEAQPHRGVEQAIFIFRQGRPPVLAGRTGQVQVVVVGQFHRAVERVDLFFGYIIIYTAVLRIGDLLQEWNVELVTRSFNQPCILLHLVAADKGIQADRAELLVDAHHEVFIGFREVIATFGDRSQRDVVGAVRLQVGAALIVGIHTDAALDE